MQTNLHTLAHGFLQNESASTVTQFYYLKPAQSSEKTSILSVDGGNRKGMTVRALVMPSHFRTLVLCTVTQAH